MSKLKDFEKRLSELNKEFSELKKTLRKVPEIGGTIEIAGIEWTVLDKTDIGYLAVAKDFESLDTKFDGDSNNWQSSELREYLNTKFLEKVETDTGKGILPEFVRDLLSLDGQTEYGKCVDKVSLLTVDEYRKYREYLPNTDKWWWLCTPWSTIGNGCDYAVTVVSPSGRIVNVSCDYFGGVRPVCIFPSSIFESEEN